MSNLKRFGRHQGALLVIDVQTKLVAAVEGGDAVARECRRLVTGARLLGVPVWCSEQYPRGLGETVPDLAAILPPPLTKLCFSCCGIPELIEQLHGRGLRQLTLAGLETHVCVQQTALDLLGLGFEVQVAADAVSSRRARDRDHALRRLELAGAVVTTVEAILFEWVQSADDAVFRDLRRLVRDDFPKSESPALTKS